MPARIFQFAAGAAIVAYHLQGKQRDRLASSSLLFALGIGCLAASAALANGDEYDFGIAAVLPAVGASIAILSIGAPAANLLLGNGLATFVGRRAYSVYLVHWPLIVMVSLYFGRAKSLDIDLGLFAASFLLGEILHRCVEQPFRLEKHRSRVNAYRTAGVFVSFFAAIAFLTHLWVLQPTVATQVVPGEGIEETYTHFVNRDHELRMKLGRYDQHCTIRLADDYSVYNYDACMKADGRPKVLILGDSMTGEANIMLSKILPPEMMLLAGTAGCAVTYPKPVTTVPEACAKLNVNRLQWAHRDDVAAIAIITQWYWQNRNQIESLLMYLRQIGKPVIVFGARPSMTTEVPTLVDSAAKLFVSSDLAPYLRYTGKDKAEEIRQIITPFEDQFLYVDQVELLCPDRCTPITAKGTPIYVDTAHLTAASLLEFADVIERKYGERIKSMVAKPLQDAAIAASNAAL